MEMMLYVERILSHELGLIGLWLFVIVLQMGTDIITGFIQAVINKEVKSGKMSNGLLKKGAILLLLIVIVPFRVLMPEYVSNSVIIFVYTIESMNEIVSICENLVNMGVDVGFMKPILKILNVYKEKNESEEKE